MNEDEASETCQATTSTEEAAPALKCAMLDGRYFKIVTQTQNGKIEAECQLCTNKKAIICGSLAATSNFTTHL